MEAYTSTGLGSLSVLPLEIRELIYRHIFADKYCYSPTSRPIGLLGASRNLRLDAMDTFYSHSTFCFHFEGDPLKVNQELLGPSQEVVNRLDHVEVSINMDHYWFRLFPGEARYMNYFFKDLFCKLLRADRVRKTCHIALRGYIHHRPWNEFPLLHSLRKLSGFRNVNLELECDVIAFEDDGLVFSSNVTPGWLIWFNNYTSAIEQSRQELRSILEATLGEGRSYETGNVRCIEFHPQTANILHSPLTPWLYETGYLPLKRMPPAVANLSAIHKPSAGTIATLSRSTRQHLATPSSRGDDAV